MSSPKAFEGKTVVITGGTSGIGYAIAEAFGEQGANIVVCARNLNPKPGGYETHPDKDIVTWLKSKGTEALFVEADVQNSGDMERVADQAISTFRSLDVWVNNAGVLPLEQPTPFWEIEEANLDVSLGVNTKGVWNGMGAAVRQMLKQENRGSIVNVLSTAAIRQHGGQSIYNISKAASAQATQCAAYELGPHGIRVNAVCPTIVKTAATRPFVENPDFKAWFKGIVPLGSVISAEQVAKSVLFLASEAAVSLTGVLLPVDQGENLGPPLATLGGG